MRETIALFAFIDFLRVLTVCALLPDWTAGIDRETVNFR